MGSPQGGTGAGTRTTGRRPPRLLAELNLRALVGSGFLWAWVDALYMSAFFRPFGQLGAMPEFAAWAISLLGAPFCLFFLVRSDLARRAVLNNRALMVVGASGLVGSALLGVSAYAASWPVLVAGSLLGALFMSFAIMAWGAVYCTSGTRSATLYVAGGFACAFVVNLLLLTMAPVAAAVAYALLPLLSMLLLGSLDESMRAYAPAPGSSGSPGNSVSPVLLAASAARARGSATTSGYAFWRTFGISTTAICSVVLIMVGFGYLQHQMSFSGLEGFSMEDGGVAMQVIRGIVALVLFCVILFFPRRASVAYRVGLLAIIAGFSLMPFLYGTDAFWASGAVVMAGYTTFDVLIWIVVAQAAHTQLSDPLRTVCIMRLLINGTCCTLGAVVAIALSGIASGAQFACADAIFVGYLMTIAVVLVLSSRDIWELFDARPPAVVTQAVGASSLDERIAQLAQAWGLTDRETDVFSLLAIGRTQPWVAENLGISESTVNSHVRHIYAKAGVNSRQELLDQVIASSPESVEASE